MVGKTGQAAIERSCAARPLRAQAAMEYLMTYGWALLVIVIVIAILLIMNPFSAPQSCKFDIVGFGCDNIVVTGQTLLGSFTNGNNNAVKVYQVNCLKSSAPKPTAPLITANYIEEVSRQGVFTFNKTGDHKVSCLDASLTSGADFSGKIWVFYRNSEDGTDYPYRVVSANLVTKVL